MGQSIRPWLLCIVGASMCWAVACADTDGRDPYALWETYTHVDGAYSFRYLAPPWELVNTGEETLPDTQIIAVEPLSGDMTPAIATGALQARYKLIVTLRAHTSAEAEARADAAVLSKSTVEPVSTAPFENNRGQSGLKVDAQLPDRNIRAVYFDLADRRAVVMQLAGRDSVAGADFTLLLKGLEPEGTGE